MDGTDDPLAGIWRLTARIPGFRSGSPWKMIVATIGYCLIGLTVLGMCVGGRSSDRPSAQPTPGRAAQPAAAQPTAPSGVLEAVKAEAVDLLGAAVSKREEGQLGIALELGRQALGKWADYPDARSFVATVQPQATAAAQQAVAQATAAQQQANAQGTAQAQASAAQAAAQATAAAAQPIVLQGRGQTATNPVTPRTPLSVVTLTHGGSANFIVRAIRGAAAESLTNHIGRYDGQRPLAGAEPVVFDVRADGAWSITVEPIKTDGSAPFGGDGDKVSAMFDPARVSGAWEFSHSGSANFIVRAHCAGGTQSVQNEIGRVSGSRVVQFGRGPCFWEVRADGAWNLTPRI